MPAAVDEDRQAIMKAVRQVRVAVTRQGRMDAQELVHTMYTRLTAKLTAVAKYNSSVGLIDAKILAAASLSEQAALRQAAALERTAQAAQIALNLKLKKVREDMHRYWCEG